MEKLGLYIHIPFCKSKCYYCDFNSYSGINKLIPEYFEVLKKEFDLWSEKLSICNINTIYIGGGTPSIVEVKYIVDLINHIKKKINLSDVDEFTIEINPGTVDKRKIEAYKNIGINRVSIGLQAWQDRILQLIGRVHTKNDFLNSIYNLKNEGFNNINVDLMFGIPTQTNKEWLESLKNIIDLDISHISTYSLKIEENTVFEKMYSDGKFDIVDDELDRLMYYKARELVEKNGYNFYEISNFSKDNMECRHNLNYWSCGKYIGLGTGAHGYILEERYNNHYDISKYIKNIHDNILPIDEKYYITNEESVKEYIILRLRLKDGIDKEKFKRKYNFDVNDRFKKELSKLKKLGLIKDNKYSIYLTNKGFDLANQVFIEFI